MNMKNKVRRYLTSSGRWEINGGFPLPLAEEIIHIHIHNMESEVNVIKKDHKRQLSRVAGAGENYVVKEFTRPGPWWIFRPDAISWRNAHKLKSLDIPIADVYGWLKSRDGRGFIIMEDLGNQVLGPILKDLLPDSSERTSFIKQLGDLVGLIHKKKLVYGDLKLTNVMIKTKSLFLVDMDKIKQKNRIRLNDRLYNLKQVLGSLPKNLTDNEFNLFLDTYLSYYAEDTDKLTKNVHFRRIRRGS